MSSKVIELAPRDQIFDPPVEWEVTNLSEPELKEMKVTSVLPTATVAEGVYGGLPVIEELRKIFSEPSAVAMAIFSSFGLRAMQVTELSISLPATPKPESGIQKTPDPISETTMLLMGEWKIEFTVAGVVKSRALYSSF